jgi:hypothetical protein
MSIKGVLEPHRIDGARGYGTGRLWDRCSSPYACSSFCGRLKCRQGSGRGTPGASAPLIFWRNCDGSVPLATSPSKRFALSSRLSRAPVSSNRRMAAAPDAPRNVRRFCPSSLGDRAQPSRYTSATRSSHPASQRSRMPRRSLAYRQKYVPCPWVLIQPDM